ncbi:SDR family oxidoreductase [Sandaracinobacter neustonicus]|uniref:SDR family oxidoreductase n=1 Tax=Sandaracinobacter neustonicus TaxID=1715348 RepID=A0A501XHN4_9SPHN|nr:SDR family oxidoreductase [Sandaracinobacter neustonicus]TPE60050.1 SDR family oxidoreductase [Sandaracinobacter neustonicus]
MTSSPKYAVTGASGELGRLIVPALAARVGAANVVAIVRDPARATGLFPAGVAVRSGDYEKPETLPATLAGVERLLLISSNALGSRVAQHRNVIEAAKAAGVAHIAYTSVLNADRSALELAEEHRQTEALLAASGLNVSLLRNGWYSENYTAGIPAALANGTLYGAAGEGRIASAPRADYAEAAAVALAGDESALTVHELAGDSAYTLGEFAAELSSQTGRDIPYVNLPQADYQGALIGAGLPVPLAELLADSDAGAANGALFDDGHALSKLIGRATVPIAQSIATALKTK